MDFTQAEVLHISPFMSRKVREVARFLEANGLRLENGIEFTVAVICNQKIAATGSLDGNVIKCVAVDKEFEGLGFAAKVVSELITYAYSLSRAHLFIFTKPENKTAFEALGFYELSRAGDDALLMENRKDGIANFLKGLSAAPESVLADERAVIGCVVANCDPFTLGHRHLIQYALGRCDFLHLFILEADKSAFPADIRYELARRGTESMRNLLLHKTSHYIVSPATFPTYFMKENADAARINAILDLNLFAERIAPCMKITRRFVGDEPLCKVKNVYNEEMLKILPAKGVSVEVVRRLETAAHEIISASRVRRLFQEGSFEELKKFVPESTFQYLMRC